MYLLIEGIGCAIKVYNATRSESNIVVFLLKI